MKDTCKSCGLTKPIEELVKNNHCTGGYEKRCRTCNSARSRAWELANPEKKRLSRERQKRGENLDINDLDRFKERCSPADENGCIPWIGFLTKGYGSFTDKEGAHQAHRWHWIRRNGVIPNNMQLDHKCRNRACVNLDHLELVTSKENTHRGLVARGFVKYVSRAADGKEGA